MSEVRKIVIELNSNGSVEVEFSGVVTKRELLRIQKVLKIQYREKLRSYIKKNRMINVEKVREVQAKEKIAEQVEEVVVPNKLKQDNLPVADKVALVTGLAGKLQNKNPNVILKGASNG